MISESSVEKKLLPNYDLTRQIEDIFPDLGRARIFSCACVRDGFWHVVMYEKSSYPTIFATSLRKHRLLRMSFRISSAPGEFQTRMGEVLEEL